MAVEVERSKVLKCAALVSPVVIILAVLLFGIIWVTAARSMNLRYSISIIHDRNSHSFAVRVRANNSNEDISFHYKKINVSMWYEDRLVFSAEVPPFHQPIGNVTDLNVDMSVSVPNITRLIDHHKVMNLTVRMMAKLRYRLVVHRMLNATCGPFAISPLENSQTNSSCSLRMGH